MDNPKVMKFASIGVGIIIAIMLVIMGFKVLSNSFTRAADFEPRDVIVSDITQNTVKLTWSTGIETQGIIEYGTSSTALNFFAPEPSKIKSHSQDLTLLSPSTTYYFQIRVSDKKYDNGGVPWTFTTKGAEKTAITAAPSPTVTPIITSTPVPTKNVIQKLDVAVTGTAKVCDETDCTKIKAKLGAGCTLQDYFKYNCK